MKTEEQRFLKIVESHKGIVYRVANSYSQNEADRDDLVQEIIFQLWRSRDRYSDRYAMSTWVYRIALNISISTLRKSNRRKNSVQPMMQPIECVASEGPTEDEDLKLLHAFIGQLKELDRALILLYLDEKSHQEMSEILGLSTSNVATRLSRVRNRLKKMFEQERKR